MKHSEIGFIPTDILIPQNTDMKKWSVVACDQYTSQPEYWERVDQFVGNAPSALRMIQPEAWLDQTDPAAANKAMDDYLEQGILRTLPQSLIYVERTLSNGKVRHGLVGALDLECYDYQKGSQSLCRATEGTVEERLPPRVRIREGASLEMPHIMVLIDDPEKTVIESLEHQRHRLQKVYDFSLMENGGHIQGYVIREDQTTPILEKLAALTGKEAHPMLYAMGDGNHSLATAKACYQKIKEQLGEKALSHPARYCLVELVNLHSNALEFEPIHRIVLHTDPQKLMQFLQAAGLEENDTYRQKIQVVQNGKYKTYSFAKETAELAVGTLQNALDAYLAAEEGEVDYIHGEDVVENLSMQKGALGFILPPMEKNDLFPTVMADGALPRKTFSMGHAQDKRFYLECRRIIEE